MLYIEIIYRCLIIFQATFASKIEKNNGDLTVIREIDGGLKDYKMCICCFSAKYTALWSNSKDWLAQNCDNVSE
jgi:hypothetical protein